jgi:Fe-S-cluster containining protein
METESSQSRARLEERILEEAPRLTKDDEFRFACHPGVSCFGSCCGDVNIVLTPYDVLRLSTEFLDKYTILPFSKDQRLPAPLIKMGDDEKKRCPFLDGPRCTVYEDRPWACRMYPVGFASPGKGAKDEQPFHFLLEEEGCRGFEEERTLTIAEWIADQGIDEYDRMGELYKDLALDAFFEAGQQLDPKKIQLYWMGTYDLDVFRRFVLESTFLARFEVPEETVEEIRDDDVELMRFAFRWLSFALFGRQTMKIKENAVPEPEK